MSVSFVVSDCTLKISLIARNIFVSTDQHNIRMSRQSIEFAWCFFVNQFTFIGSWYHM